MTTRFWEAIDNLKRLMAELHNGKECAWSDYSEAPRKGIYVFYENGEPIYVGRSDRLKDRLLEHGREGSRNQTAPFAFNIAREEFQENFPGHDAVPRNDLEIDPRFAPLFREATRRVEIQDPIEQTIFEVYAHLKLGTRFNSFENH